jgi:hypothetical protein
METDIHFNLFYQFMKLYKTENKYQRITWNVISSNMLLKVWKDYVKFGFVKNEKAIDTMQEILIHNIIKLDLSNILAGHEVVGALEDKLDLFGLDENYPEINQDDFTEAFSDFFNDENDNWRISDYGLPKLKNIAIELLTESSYEKKLLLIDRALNICHQRSDLSAWFIEGGVKTLNKLQND